jgi:hypothetical protein
MTAAGDQRLAGDRLDRPAVTHRLDDQATPDPTGHPQAAALPDPKRCTATLLKAPAPDGLKLPPP